MADKNRHGAEALDYSVIKKYDAFEIRKYDSINIVSVETKKPIGSQGFSMLFNYISGQNEEKKEIPMTAPVINKVSETASNMAFVMPGDMTLETIPKPLREGLIIKQMNSGYYAVSAFKGLNNQKKINRKIEAFRELLEEKGFSILSEFYLARFDPPFTLPMLRRNEIMVEIDYEVS